MLFGQRTNLREQRALIRAHAASVMARSRRVSVTALYVRFVAGGLYRFVTGHVLRFVAEGLYRFVTGDVRNDGGVQGRT
jgi:hypothetical protein